MQGDDAEYYDGDDDDDDEQEEVCTHEPHLDYLDANKEPSSQKAKIPDADAVMSLLQTFSAFSPRLNKGPLLRETMLTIFYHF